mgnify:CR=1 FL=1
MSFRCVDVLKLFPPPKLQVLGGADGLDRIVRWVYVAEAMDSILNTLNWLSGNELVIITGSNISGDPAPVIVEFIRNCAEKRVAGVVVNTGRYIPRVPDEAVRAADELKLPLMVTPWETRLVEFTKDICTAIIDQSMEYESTNTLADNLLFGQDPLTENTRFLLAKYGFEDAPGYLVIVFTLEEGPEPPARDRAEVRAYLVDLVRNAFERERRQALITRLGDNVVAILKSGGNHGRLREFLLSVAEFMQNRHPGYRLQIGVGRPCHTVREIPGGYHTALQVVRAQRFDELGAVVFFENIDVYTLLLAIEDGDVLRSYYHDLFSALLDYDRSNKTTLMQTLESYIDHNAHLASTAKALFIHENTLKYRLNKIRSLINADIGLIEEQSRISIGLKIGRLLSRSGEDL